MALETKALGLQGFRIEARTIKWVLWMDKLLNHVYMSVSSKLRGTCLTFINNLGKKHVYEWPHPDAHRYQYKKGGEGFGF